MGKNDNPNNRQLAERLDRKLKLTEGRKIIVDTRFNSPHFDGMMPQTQTLVAYPDDFKARMMRSNVARAKHVKPLTKPVPKPSRFLNQAVLRFWGGCQRRDG
jgi:hypothetical protein